MSLIIGIILTLDILFAQFLKFNPNLIFANTDQYWKIGEPLDHYLRPDLDRDVYWLDQSYRLRTNSLGLKDEKTGRIVKKTVGPRILLLGDSFTEGVGIEYKHTFAGVMAQNLKDCGVSVLNGGTFSYSPALYYRQAKLLIEEKGVLVSHIVAMIDISDIQNEFDYFFDTRENVKRKDPRSDIFHLKQFLKTNSLLFRVADMIKDRLQYKETVDIVKSRNPLGINSDLAKWTIDKDLYQNVGEDGLKIAASRMERLYQLARQNNITLSVGVYPWPDQIWHRDRESVQVRFWYNWTNKRRLEFINMFPEFINASPRKTTIEKYFIPHDTHWNVTGHRKVADILLTRFRPRFCQKN